MSDQRENSNEAFRNLGLRADSQRAAVRAATHAAGPSGITDRELARACRLTSAAARTRRLEVMRGGVEGARGIYYTGQQRTLLSDASDPGRVTHHAIYVHEEYATPEHRVATEAYLRERRPLDEALDLIEDLLADSDAHAAATDFLIFYRRLRVLDGIPQWRDVYERARARAEARKRKQGPPQTEDAA